LFFKGGSEREGGGLGGWGGGGGEQLNVYWLILCVNLPKK